MVKNRGTENDTLLILIYFSFLVESLIRLEGNSMIPFNKTNLVSILAVDR